MPAIESNAYAKLNLTLDVLGRRPDGYHDMCMVMQTVSLCDHLLLEYGTGMPVQVRSNLEYLPTGGSNLAAAAALRLCEAIGRECGVSIAIQKGIPVCAGLAGGSADAAAVLRGLNQLLSLGLSWERLAEIGQRVGSDVPYCVLGGTALAEGRGETLTPLNSLPSCWVVLCKPNFSISTPELFGRLDSVHIRCRPDTAGVLAALDHGDLMGVAQRMYNVFEDVLPERRGAEVAEIKNTLIQQGALGASMSGTGPTVFGLFDQRSQAGAAFRILRESYRETYLAETIGQVL
ncbi:MAG: 4-(cytidine 5'-diphospho)-2-C-methyl-D-erythritol kinase [Oscillospiraceae bacterium]|nr:4-(cytidine 5'-diphospho)-2-C-methyl-D-erythritol kinase [Oscillospiraceae bacterium]